MPPVFCGLPRREHVFLQSLRYHGFRYTHRRKNLKYRRGYVIPATRFEDAGGIDFWIKMPRDERLFPVQVTQRGTRILRRYWRRPMSEFAAVEAKAEERMRAKRALCRRHGIAFVLVADYAGFRTNRRLAWGDIKALRHGIAHMRRWLSIG